MSLLLLASPLSTIQVDAQQALPRIKVLATGGTIANTPSGAPARRRGSSASR